LNFTFYLIYLYCRIENEFTIVGHWPVSIKIHGINNNIECPSFTDSNIEPKLQMNCTDWEREWMQVSERVNVDKNPIRLLYAIVDR